MVGIATNMMEVIQHNVTAGLQLNAEVCCELPLALSHLAVYHQQQAMSCIYKLCQCSAVNGAAEICEAAMLSRCCSLCTQ